MTHEPANTTGKGGGDKDEEPVRYTVLSRRAIVLWAMLILAAGVGMVVWLLLAYGANGDARVQLEAIRTAGTLVVGAGGAAALLLAARRQRSTEIALKQKEHDQRHQERVAGETRAHQERVAAATEHDAAQRRVTELYTAAAAQLGSDKAPVRLAGLYALERLAQDNAPQRQTIVNVLCAYLRMPHALPDELSADSADGGTDQDQVAAHAAHIEQIQERGVRLTAQRVLTAHLRPEDVDNPAETFWADIDIDLTGAILINLDLRHCLLRTARFTHATLVGDTSFARAKVADGSSFERARFTDNAAFVAAEFAGNTSFAGVTFAGNASFDRVRFVGNPRSAGRAAFDRAEFAGDASFINAKIAGMASFEAATFAGETSFKDAVFADHAEFVTVQFTKDTSFVGVRFAGDTWFDGAKFAGRAWFSGAKFAASASFERAEFASSAGFSNGDWSQKTLFSDNTSFRAVVFAREVPTVVERFWSPPQAKQAPDPATEPDRPPG